MFHDAVARDPSVRDAFVAAACKDDSALRQEVAKLIAAHDVAAHFDEMRGLSMPPVPHLEPGSRLGFYRVDAWIGAGGMGEVYRATDTKLVRTVALKILSPVFGQDPERVARFHREAQILAALNHPHIAHIYGLETIGDVTALVMEMVEGSTLADRIADGPIALDETLNIAKQLADALDAAHQQGIVHRDLKPANVKVTLDGLVKVLDFGLAKALETSSSSDPALTATASSGITRPGLILGTAAYMAPEQARGKQVDRRADIWSFGCVVYEMLTGIAAFSGESMLDTLTAVLERTPAWDRLPETVPPNVRRSLHRCLEKDSKRRARDIGDVWLDLEQSDGVDDAPTRLDRSASTLRSKWKPLVTLVGGGIVGVALAATVLSWRPPPPTAPPLAPVVRFMLPVEPVPSTKFGVSLNLRLAISRDGRRLAYVSERPDKTTTIFLRQLASPETVAVPGTEGATTVFFSPDGEELGFFAGGKLKRVSVRGGTVRTICDVAQGAGASWGDDNTIVFAPSAMSVLMRVSVRGGTPAPMTTLQKGEVSHRWPEFLPDGTAIAYAASNSDDFTSSRIVVQSLRTGERTEIGEGTYPRYTSNGYIVFARETSLLALPFDIERLRPIEKPRLLANDLRMNTVTGGALFAVSHNALVYRPVGASFVPRLMVWVDTNGNEEIVPLEPRPILQPRLSPDGTRVAFTVGERTRDRDVWIYDFAHRAAAQLTVETGEDETAVWSRDGGRIAFSATRDNQPRMILALPSSGGGQPTHLGSGRYSVHVSDWSPDGGVLAWTEFDPASGGKIRVITADGSRTIQTLTNTAFDNRGAVFSPDGRWLAYTSNESGRDEVYAQPYPGPGPKRRISVGGGQEPAWPRADSRIYFRGQDRMMSVDVRTSPTFVASTPGPLFVDKYETEHNADRNYDVSADGRRFLMLKTARPFLPAELNVVLNWSATLTGKE